MSVLKLAGRYAKSIMDLSIEQGKLETVYGNMVHVKDILSKNRDLLLMLRSPVIAEDKKEKVVALVFEESVDELTLSFFRILLTKRRGAYLSDIADAFIQQYNTYKHIINARVYTAAPIDEASKELMSEYVREKTAARQVVLKNEVDRSLIGGFVLQYGDKRYDASIAHQLLMLKKEFSNNDYIKHF